MDPKTVKESLDDLVLLFSTRMESFESQLSATPNTTPNLEVLTADYYNFKTFVLKSLCSITAQVETVAHAVDQQEMRSRRKMILLHGIQESSKEETTTVVVKTVVDILKLTSFTAADISRCHRMGRAMNTEKPRPILCKLRDISVRDNIWAAKTNFKGSGMTMSEFLTKWRRELFLAARQHVGVSNCWTRGGFIFVQDADGTRRRIESFKDLNASAQEITGSDDTRPESASASVSAWGPTTRRRANSKARTEAKTSKKPK